MYRWCRKRKRGIAVISALVTVLVIGVTRTDDSANRHRHETISHRDRGALNIGRKQLQADIEYFSNQGTAVHHQEPWSELKHVTVENDRPESSNREVAEERPKLLVYIYELPSKFNVDLLRCATNNTVSHYDRSNSHSVLSDSTVGNDSSNVEGYLEVLLHRTLSNSNYVTTDASKADVLFIPFYPTLACTCGDRVNITDLHDRLWKFLDDALPYFRDGKPSRPHFMAMSTHERHHWKKKCPLLRDGNHTRNVIVIGPEKESKVELRQYVGRDTSPMIVVPYPSHHELIRGAEEQNRNILIFFPDSTRSVGRGIRTLLRDEIIEIHTPSSGEDPPDMDKSAVRYICDSEDIASNMLQTPCSQTTYSWMRRSVFCLQAPADTEIRASFYDAISAGGIPVTFLPWSKRRKAEFPFEEKLDYSMFTINIPPDRLLAHEQNATWYLSTVPKLRITILQRRLKQFSKQLLYSKADKSKNAFEMVIEEMLNVSS